MRQYKKDFEDCKKRLSKAEYEYAFEKNKEMLIGAHLDVNTYLVRNKNQVQTEKNY
jgi:hypothetical protein